MIENLGSLKTTGGGLCTNKNGLGDAIFHCLDSRTKNFTFLTIVAFPKISLVDLQLKYPAKWSEENSNNGIWPIV